MENSLFCLRPGCLHLRVYCFLTIFSLCIYAHELTAQTNQPDDGVSEPNWLSVSGQVRARYEALNHPLREGVSNSENIVVTRTSLKALASSNHLDAWVEWMDARQFSASDSLKLNTSIVNTNEWIQYAVSLKTEDFIHPGSQSQLTVGRFTLDVGSRRLVARNRYRNTVNTFSGFLGTWAGTDGTRLMGFYLDPVARLPDDQPELHDNQSDWDHALDNTQFSGLMVEGTDLLSALNWESFVFYLDARDEPSFAVADREIWTLGGRLLQPASVGSWDFELEGAYQWGESAFSSNATQRLDHKAWFVHAESGYTFSSAWQPRLLAQLDYATGDKDPNDHQNNRFDTLYGARRFDFGPTSIYGAFARTNVLSPGLRWYISPSDTFDLMLVYRWYWLASEKDAWSGAGIQDESGQSGRYLGRQSEAQIRWYPWGKSLVWESGLAYLRSERVTRLLGGPSDALYGYTQLSYTF